MSALVRHKKTSTLNWPSFWRYCKVAERKNPYEDGWQHNPLQFDDIWATFNNEPRCKAIGLLCGPVSGGIVMVDHDGWSCDPLIDAYSKGVGLPDTVTVTSGRNGRWQCVYIVPEDYWDRCKSRKKITHTDEKTGDTEQLEIRWKGLQSVIYGHHPDTDGYRWVNSPDNTDIAIAPDWVIDLLVNGFNNVDVKPLGERDELDILVDKQKITDILSRITSKEAYHDWLIVGMACKTACPESFELWKNWSKGAENACQKDSEYDYKWKTFKNRQDGVTFGTLVHYANQERKHITSKSVDPEDPTQGQKPNQLMIVCNIVRMLWGEKLRYNEFTKDIELSGEPVDTDLLKVEMAFKANKDTTEDRFKTALYATAKDNSYNPIRDYLERCEPVDGILDNLSTRYFGTSEALYDTYVKKMLISAVARVIDPGCKVDTALILQGHQGMKKSTFFEVLASKVYFDDSLGQISDKDEKLKLHLSWIIEWAELEHVFGRKGISAVKAFMSSSTDVVRPPYGRRTERMPRQSIIVGSTNEEGFLTDPTGSRRFWAIPVKKKIDKALLQSERDAIWGAAYQAYKNGEIWYLNDDEQEMSNSLNKEFEQEDPWEAAVKVYLNGWGLPVVTVTQLLKEALNIPIDRHDRRAQMKIGTILKALGYERSRLRYNNVRVYYYACGELPNDISVSLNTLVWFSQLYSVDRTQFLEQVDSLELSQRDYLKNLLGKNLF